MHTNDATTVNERWTALDDAAGIVGTDVDELRRWAKRGLFRCRMDGLGRRTARLSDVVSVRDAMANPKAKPPRFEVLSSPVNGYTTLELFAGAGGTALGLANAGFFHLMLNEFDADACRSLRANRPQWNVVEEDVHDLSFEPYKGRVDLLQGGVPCQTFSYAGNRKGFGDPRGTLFFEFARAVGQSHPRFVVMENVKGLLTHDHGRTVATMLSTLMDLGYDVSLRVLHAQFLDVAQKRERLFILGRRSDLGLPMYWPRQDGRLMTLWDAIGDCPESDGASYPESKRRVLEQVPPGGCWRDLPVDEQRRYLGASYASSGGKTGMARRLSWSEPSLTLTCSPVQKQTERCHPEHTRPLTVREYARIQSFPDEWEFHGGLPSRYRQIGNAVPVNMAYHVGRAVAVSLDGAGRDGFLPAHVLTSSDLDADTIRAVALSCE